MDSKKFFQIIGHTFNKEDLLKEALTHRSYLNENNDWPLPHNERLEFLGDAVLELVVTEELFNRFPKEKEGWMTSVRAALVNTVMLSQVADRLNLGDYILLSRGEQKDGNGRAREAIRANTIEALIGAIYLDAGYDAAKKFISSHILSNLAEVIRQNLHIDAKSFLQEKVQAEFKLTPSYSVLEDSGPDHNKTFKIGVYFGDKLIASGLGQSKQDGEVCAARNALELLEAGKVSL